MLPAPDACLSIDLRARPVARTGRRRHRRRLRHRPLHRARARVARRARGADRPQADKLARACRRDRGDGGRCELPRLRHPRRRRGEGHGRGRRRARTAASTGWSTTPAASSSRRWRAISAKGCEAVVATNLTGGFLMARECSPCRCHAASTAAPSSTSSPTSGAACRAWATAARRAPAWSTSPRPRRSSGPRGVRVNAVAPG